MDAIHPIRRTSAQPPPVAAVRRVERAGEDREQHERRGRARPQDAAPAPESEAETAAGHVDARV